MDFCRSVVQFQKPPLPLVAAQSDTNYWQIQYFAQEKTYSGRGLPPEREHAGVSHAIRSFRGSPRRTMRDIGRARQLQLPFVAAFL